MKLAISKRIVLRAQNHFLINKGPFRLAPGDPGQQINPNSYAIFGIGEGVQKRAPVAMGACTGAPFKDVAAPVSISSSIMRNLSEVTSNLCTPLKVSAFEVYLSGHPDQQFPILIKNILIHGADIGYRGPNFPRSTANSVSARVHCAVLREQISKEIRLGHSAGPFASPPFPNFVSSALGVCPKHNGGFRVILDLSRPSGNSINDFIDPEWFPLTLCGVDDAVNLLVKHGRGSLMSKLDIKHAFRLIPVRQQDWRLLGFSHENRYFYDRVLPFGCRSSPFLFCLFSEAIRWIVADRMNHPDILVYMDDFFIAAPPNSSKCSEVLDGMQRACSNLGVPVATEKTLGPATKLVFLGIELDSIHQTLSLPQGKHEEIVRKLKTWSRRKTCSRTELQSLVGLLQFAAKCVPAGRLFTRRLIDRLKLPSERSSNPLPAMIVLDEEFFADIRWWQKFLPQWNGVASFLQTDWRRSDVINLYTDACSTIGFGAYFDGSWFNAHWPDWLSEKPISIEYMELIPILFALEVWKEKLFQQRIIIHCDNLGATQAWAAFNSKNRSILDIMRKMVFISAKNNFTFTLKHIRGVDNSVADALSRFQVLRFQKLAPNANALPEKLPSIFPALREVYLRHSERRYGSMEL